MCRPRILQMAAVSIGEVQLQWPSSHDVRLVNRPCTSVTRRQREAHPVKEFGLELIHIDHEKLHVHGGATH